MQPPERFFSYLWILCGLLLYHIIPEQKALLQVDPSIMVRARSRLPAFPLSDLLFCESYLSCTMLQFFLMPRCIYRSCVPFIIIHASHSFILHAFHSFIIHASHSFVIHASYSSIIHTPHSFSVRASAMQLRVSFIFSPPRHVSSFRPFSQSAPLRSGQARD